MTLLMHVFVSFFPFSSFYPKGKHSQLIPNDLTNSFPNIYRNTRKEQKEKNEKKKKTPPISGAAIKGCLIGNWKVILRNLNFFWGGGEPFRLVVETGSPAPD